ncbi:hypothetical protein EMCRGX_G032011 [Ephydatia muelleri]
MVNLYTYSDSHTLQSLWAQREHLIVCRHLLYRQWIDASEGGESTCLQFVLPWVLVSQVLRQWHDSATAGHLGVQKTLDKIRGRFYWVGQRQIVEDWCRHCETCAARKPAVPGRVAPMQGSQQCLVVLLQCKEASSAWSCCSNARKPAVPGRVAPMQGSQQCLVVLLQCKEASSAWSCCSNARKPAVPGRVAPMQGSQQCLVVLLQCKEASSAWSCCSNARKPAVPGRVAPMQGSQQCLVVLLQCKEASSAWSCCSNARKPAVPGRVAPMQSSASGTPFQRLAMNIVGPFPRADKVSAYILVIGDYFTKWVAYPMQVMEATAVAVCFDKDAQEEGTGQLRKRKDNDKYSVPDKEGRDASADSDTDEGEVIIGVEHEAPGHAELGDHEAEHDQDEAPGEPGELPGVEHQVTGQAELGDEAEHNQVEAPVVPPLVLRRSTRIPRPPDRF